MATKRVQSEDAVRRARLADLEGHLSGWMQGRGTDEVVTDLANLQIALLARRYPATLTQVEKQRIQENYPLATDPLIAERSMSVEGVALALALATQIAKIAIDYSPLSHCKADVDNDERHQSVIRDVLEPAVSAAYQASLKAGLSPYGATTMLIALGAMKGLQHGVNWVAIARPLVEMVGVTMRRGSTVEMSAEQEEMAIRALMAQMGISRKEAKKYAAFAEQMMRDQK